MVFSLQLLLLLFSWQVKAKTITEIHTEAEKNLGLRPGATASIRNNRGIISGAQGSTSPGGFAINRPGTGGMMPGMPGARKMPGMPGIDNDNWEVPRTRSMPRGDVPAVQNAGRGQSALFGKATSLNTRLLPQGSGGFISGKTSALLQGSSGPPARPSNFVVGAEIAAQAPPFPSKPVPAVSIPPVAEKPWAPQAPATKVNLEALRKKTISILEEYFEIRDLNEALQCVEEMNSPTYHAEVVKEAIALASEKSSPCIEPVVRLLEYLFSKMVITARDIETGCLHYATNLDDVGIDVPKAPNSFGQIIGKLLLLGALDFKVVREVLEKVGDDRFQKAIFEAGMGIIRSSPSGQGLLESQASDIEACRSVLQKV